MRVSLYGAVNILLAALWVVFIPSYAMLVHCPTCPDFLKAAGELVELLWHPNTHRIKLKYGAGTGQAQYLPGSDNGVFRPACVPCPTELLAQQVVPYSNKDNQTSGRVSSTYPQYKAQSEDLVHCVKVNGFNLPSGAATSITGGAGVDAKTYVHYQLFGPDHEAIVAKLYTVGLKEGSRKPRDLAWIRQQIDSQVRSGKTFFNTKLFKRRSPWPYINAPLGDETIQPVLYGYYMLNGRPFIPPKLWDYRPFSQSNGDRYSIQLKGSTKKYSITSNITNLTSAASYTASGYMVGQANGHQPGAIEPMPLHPSTEHEWWYGNACPQKGCGDEWALKTSLQYWGTDHYADYIARFFAGGKDFTCVWFGS